MDQTSWKSLWYSIKRHSILKIGITRQHTGLIPDRPFSSHFILKPNSTTTGSRTNIISDCIKAISFFMSFLLISTISQTEPTFYFTPNNSLSRLRPLYNQTYAINSINLQTKFNRYMKISIGLLTISKTLIRFLLLSITQKNSHNLISCIKI